MCRRTFLAALTAVCLAPLAGLTGLTKVKTKTRYVVPHDSPPEDSSLQPPEDNKIQIPVFLCRVCKQPITRQVYTGPISYTYQGWKSRINTGCCLQCWDKLKKDPEIALARMVSGLDGNSKYLAKVISTKGATQ